MSALVRSPQITLELEPKYVWRVERETRGKVGLGWVLFEKERGLERAGEGGPVNRGTEDGTTDRGSSLDV